MKSFISWIGGKHLLKKEIIKRFPNEKFNKYVEVFGGAGWVLFEKDKNSHIEIYNDSNGELVNLFRCAKYHCEELQRELEFILNSREIFEGYKNLKSCCQTDIQRAARFFMLIKFSFGSKAENFGCSKRDGISMVQYLKDINERLKSVVIENKDFETIINTHNKIDTLFFLDPPYYGTEKYYSEVFSKEDHIRLFNTIKNTKSKFILTYNDCDYVKELYKNFNIEDIRRNNNLNTNKNTFYNELIITNYKQ